MKVLVITAVVIVALCLVYMWLIMPNLHWKKEKDELGQWFYAHRGLHDNDSGVPENSMAAFRRAVEAGYGMELDIQLCKDKIPVVFHDFTLKRICGVQGRVCDYTYEELQGFSLCGSEEKIPAFEQVLELVQGRVPLIVEFKIPNMDISLCPIADRLLVNYRGLYCVESFHPLALHWYRTHRPGVVRGQLSDCFMHSKEHRGVGPFIMQNLLLNFYTKPDFIAYNHQYKKGLSRRLCHGFYKNTAVAWTIKDERQLQEAHKYFDIYIFENFIPMRNHS